MNTKVCKNWDGTNQIHECWEEDNKGFKQGWLQSFDKNTGNVSYEVYYEDNTAILTIIYHTGYRVINIPKNNSSVYLPIILAHVAPTSKDNVKYLEWQF